MITFDYVHSTLTHDEIYKLESSVQSIHDMLHTQAERGIGYTGWINWPIHYPTNIEFTRLKHAAEQIQRQSDVLLVIGIGGSYLGAKAAIEMLTHSFYNQLPANKRKTPEIYFLGTDLSTKYLTDLLDILDGKQISVNVISKSGTTTEPAIAFRIIRDYMVKRFGKQACRERIFITTDRQRGTLKQLADQEEYVTFVFPENIGGRYSVLTPVGLLPMACAGIAIDEVMAGAQEGYHIYAQPELEYNPAYQYAVARNLLYSKGKTIEILASHEPSLKYFTEWWKQLFGESEGKKHKGIFPVSAQFTTDLHTLGQYIQEGLRNLFETILQVVHYHSQIRIEKGNNSDNLNYLAGYTLHEINTRAVEAAVMAHVDGGVPCLKIIIPEISPYYFGQLVYFFEKACAMSAYLLGVNPFDQPGVEAYKKIMFDLLTKQTQV